MAHAGQAQQLPGMQLVEAVEVAGSHHQEIVMQGMMDLIRREEIPPGARVLYAHLGGMPAINGYSYLFRNG